MQPETINTVEDALDLFFGDNSWREHAIIVGNLAVLKTHFKDAFRERGNARVFVQNVMLGLVGEAMDSAAKLQRSVNFAIINGSVDAPPPSPPPPKKDS